MLKACLLLIPIFVAIFATPDSTVQFIGDSMRIGDIRFRLLAVLLVWLALTIFVGVGLLRGNSIARHIFLIMLAVILMALIVMRQRYVELPIVFFVFGLATWYLYVRPNVRKFFEST